jgi:signal transduction histidine kinase
MVLSRASGDLVLVAGLAERLDDVALEQVRDELPVVFVVGEGQAARGERLMARGARDFVHPGESGRLLSVLERELAQARRFAKLHQLAQRGEDLSRVVSTVVHDFNNILSVVDTYAGFLVEDLQPDTPSHQDAMAIADNAKRGALLVSQLMSFTSQPYYAKELLSPNLVVQGIRTILDRVLGEDVGLELDLGDGVAEVKADRASLQQIVLQLCMNAREAMPGGGRLRVSTRVQVDSTEWADGYVVIAVADTGMGILPHDRNSIFDPFFTTKATSKARGIGLTTVRRIVKDHGGRIEIQSEPGAGTVMEVLLPMASAKSTSAESARSLAGTVLLVEDEQDVRRAVRRMLERGGLRVLEAEDGRAAIELCCTTNEPIHVLLADLGLPRMRGPELATVLRDHNPGMKVLYMSGYMLDSVEGMDDPPPADAFLQKPIEPGRLLRKLGALLAQ